MAQQPQGVAMALAEVEAALRTLLLGPAPSTASTASTATMEVGGSSGGKGKKPKEDAAAAAHRFLQTFQKQPAAGSCAAAGLAAALAHPETPPPQPHSPLPLFLAQTLALRARKAWAAGGLAPHELEQAAGLFLRCCCGGGGREGWQCQQWQWQQQVGTQLGLALCAGVIGCPRIGPSAVFGEAMGLVERMAAASAGSGVGDGVVEAAQLRVLQLLPEEALRSRSLSIPSERRRAVLRALATGDAASSAPPPAAQALHHLAALQQPPSTATAIFAAMGAWLELDWLPWDTVVGPWLPRALELAHAAVGRWAGAAGRGDGDEEAAAEAAAAALELLAGVVAPSNEDGEEGGPPVGHGRGRAAEEEAARLRRHRRRQGIEAGAAILPLLPHVWAAVSGARAHPPASHFDSPVGHAALNLVVAVGLAGLPGEVGQEPREEQEEGLLPLYRDPGPILTPLLVAVAEGPLPSAALAFRFWQALGDDAAANDAAPTPSHAATEAAVLHFVAAVVRRSTFPPGFPSAVSLEARQAFEEFREEAREVLRGVVGSSGTSSARGSAVAATLTEELWRLLQQQQQQQQQPSSSEEQAFPFEALVHALSALGKDLPRLLPPASLNRLVATLPTLPPHPAIARSGALLLSTLPDWLVSSAADQTTLHAALQLLLASLAFLESEREPFPLKSKQDHAGVIALLKLAQAGPARLAAVPEAAERLIGSYHALRHHYQQPHRPPPPLESRSQLLLLDAAVRVSVHLPTEAAATAQLERLCAPMWTGVAAALASHGSSSNGNGNGSIVGGGEQDGDDDAMARELRALATVVQAAGGAGAGDVGALVACFLARGEGIRGLLAHETHGRQAWTRGAVALTASLLRALGQAVSAAGAGAPSMSGAMVLLEAYRQCLQGWAPTLLHQLSAPTAPVPLFPCFLEWAEAALLPLLNHTTTSSSSDTSALVPAAWDVYATVARRCGEALLALTGAAGNGTARGGASEAREDLAAAFFASLSRVLQLLPPPPCSSSSSSSSPTTTLNSLLARDPVLLPLALQAACACLDMQGREAGKALCGFVRRAASAAAAVAAVEPAGGDAGTAGVVLRWLFAEPGRVGGGEQAQQPPQQPQGVWLTLGLMAGVCGAMPSWMLDDLIAALAGLFQAFGAQTAGGWMAAAIAHPAFPRAHVSEQARTQFLEQIARCVLPPSAGLADPQQLRAFKTSVKAFCGGKKKGTSGTPSTTKPTGSVSV